jgi:hypothetical protein
MLQFGRLGVMEALPSFFAVARHGEADKMVVVVPMQGKPNVALPLPIHGDFIVAFKCVDEMIGVCFANIFHTEVIDTEGKADGSPIMCPETGVDFALVVTIGLEALFEELLRNDAGLWESMHTFLNALKDISIMCNVM